MMLIPFANLFVPLFATTYFTHIFKSIARDWCLVGVEAESRIEAAPAFRPPRLADIAAVENEPVMCVHFEPLWHRFLQAQFYLEGHPSGAEPVLFLDPEQMRIDRDRWCSKSGVYHNICRLATHSRQSYQCFSGCGTQSCDVR